MILFRKAIFLTFITIASLYQNIDANTPESETTQSSTVSVGFEGVIAERSNGRNQFMIILQALQTGNFVNILRLNSLRTKNEGGEKHFYDKDGNIVRGGGYMELAYVGCNNITDPKFTNFVPAMMETSESYTKLKPGIAELFRYLKDEKKCEIMVATNKDHISHEQVMEAIGANDLPSKSLVVQQDKKWLDKNLQPKNDANSIFRLLVKSIKYARETENIKHSEKSKPDSAYYDKLVREAHGKKIVHFDTRKNLPTQKRTDMIYYAVEPTTSVAEIVDKLKLHNILDPENNMQDAQLIEKLKQSGTFGWIAYLKALFGLNSKAAPEVARTDN